MGQYETKDEQMLKEEEQSTNGGPKNEGGAKKADFPRRSLAKALKVPQALIDANGGNPLPPLEMAVALDRSPRSSEFEMIVSSSFKYGMTKGNSRRGRVSMEDLGSRIVEPTTEGEREAAVVSAALHPPTFKAIYEAYKGKKIPEGQFMENALVRDFGVARNDAQACAQLFLENVRFAGLIRQTQGGEYLSTETDSPEPPVATDDAVVEDDVDLGDDITDEVDGPDQQPPPAPEKTRPSAIFVGARKGKSLEQLVSLLVEYRIPHKVAELEANMGRPIPQKVKDTMKECGAGILIFDADEEYFDKDGNSIWKPSDNLIHELGAAGMEYGDRIILFKEERVRMASNYDSIGRIEFEQGKLDAKSNELLRELIAFKILTLAVNT